MEFWKIITSSPTRGAAAARRAEEAGWSGVLVVDSQNLAGDSYVSLTSMALATGTIGIGTGVTNPVTRHPAVTASAMASIQRLSAGEQFLESAGVIQHWHTWGKHLPVSLCFRNTFRFFKPI